MGKSSLHTVQCIALYSPSWPPGAHPNGIVTTVGILRPALQAAGIRTIILTSKLQEDVDDPDVVELIDKGCFWRAKGLPFRIGWRLAKDYVIKLRSIERVKKAILTLPENTDLIEWPDTFGNTRGLNRALGIPVVVRLHGPHFLNHKAYDYDESSKFRKRVLLEGKAIQMADGVTSPSAVVLERTRTQYRRLPAHSAIIPNPCTPVPEEEQWRLEECNRHEILYVGRFDRLKGADTVLAGFEQVWLENPALRLTFVGPDGGMGTQPKIHFEAYCQKHHPKLLAEGAVRFLGKVPHAKLPELRRRAFVTVVASRWENFPNTVLEVMAYGCPLVATRTGGIAEIVEDGKTGLFFEVDNVEGLASAIKQLLQNPNRAAALGAAAAQEVIKRYNPDSIAQTMIAYYQEVLEAWRQRTHSK